jgi:hypothetical protein
MQQARQSAGKVVSIHRSCSGRIIYLSDLGVELGSSYDLPYFHQSLRTDVCKMVATVRGYRSVQYSSKLFSQLDYMMSRFGVTGPASLAWELVPFSFVVDWFVDLRGITDRLDNLLTGNTKKILDICLSEKLDMTGKTSVRNYGGYTSSNDGEVIQETQLKYYHRSLGVAPSIVAPSGRFGKKQASLLAALLYQQVANRLKD